MKILIINGPNLNMLGKRESQHYGSFSYDQLLGYFKNLETRLSVDIIAVQSNIEGEIVGHIQSADHYDALVINAGGYSHTSVAIMDALLILDIPIVEVHISNIHAREDFRKTSLSGKAALGVICGLGKEGYGAAVEYLVNKAKKSS